MYKDEVLNFFHENLQKRELELKQQLKDLELYKKRLNSIEKHFYDDCDDEEEIEDEDIFIEREIIKSIKKFFKCICITDVSNDSKNYLKSIGCKIESAFSWYSGDSTSAKWDVTSGIIEKYKDEYKDYYILFDYFVKEYYDYIYFLKIISKIPLINLNDKEALYNLFTKKYIDNNCEKYKDEYKNEYKKEYEKKLGEFKEKLYDKLINFPIERLLVDYISSWEESLEKVEIIYNETLDELEIDEKYKINIFNDKENFKSLIYSKKDKEKN